MPAVKRAFVGFGALGRQIASLLEDTGASGEAVYCDDQLHQSGAANARPFKAYDSDELAQCSFYVCLGYKHLGLKQQIIDRLVQLGRSVPAIIHPTAYIHPSSTIGAGCAIYPGCNIDRNTQLGRGVCLINATVIAHDCSVGDACWLSPGVTLSGKVRIGARTFVGTASAVANDLDIGADVIVGVGTVVTKPIADGASAIGNPMRILDRRLSLS